MIKLLLALMVAKTDGSTNRVAKVAVEATSLGRVVDIACEGEPVYTVFRLNDPVRIVIDIARGDVSKLDGPIEIDDGVIGDIATAQFADDRHALGRLIIGLEKAFDYEVKQAGKHIKVTVRANVPAPAALAKNAAGVAKVAKVEPVPLAQPVPPAVAPRNDDAAKAEAAKRAEQAKLAADKAAADKAEQAKLAADRAAAEKAELERQVMAKVEAESAAQKSKQAKPDVKPEPKIAAAPALVPVTKPMVSVHEQKSQVVVDKTLEKVTVHKRRTGSEVVIKIKGGKPAYEVLELEDPPRVVFDLIGVNTKLPKSSSWNLGEVGKLRIGIHDDKTRLVLDGATGLPKYDLQVDDNGMKITTELLPSKQQPAPALVAEVVELKEPAPAPAVATKQPAKPAAPEKPAAVDKGVTLAAAPMAKPIELKTPQVATLDFKKNGELARLSFPIPDSARFELDRSIERAPALIVNNVELIKALEKASDVSSLGTGVARLTSFNDRGGKSMRIVANIHDKVTHKVWSENGQLIWEFATPLAPPPAIATQMKPAPEVAGFSQEATQMLQTTTTAQTSSRRINIDVRGADLLNVLRLISDVSGENIVAGDDVTGKITLRLRNVPWEQALDAALKTKGYGRVRSGSIIRVAPLDKLQKEKEAELARIKADEQIQPTFVRLIPINYANAKDINDQIKQLLTKDRGKATVDERTNTIVAEDLVDVLNKIEALARRLDTQTPQVLIESRIVEANTQHVRDIGIQWGGSGLFSPATGNATGLAFPNLIGFNGGADDATTNTTGTANPGRFAVNLPAPVSQGSGGALGLVFGNASNTGLLSLRLSALENNGSVRIVSAPKVTTLDNVRAKISQGVSIPISVTSAAGVNTRFVDAFLELEVKPHVTQDGSIMMEIKATKNEPNFSRTGAAGDPTLDKKQAETQVLVKDGDTTVIGGIYTRNTATTYNEVPFISKIPVLGWLFKRKRTQDDRAELLVFITPRIINRQQSSIVAGGGL